MMKYLVAGFAGFASLASAQKAEAVELEHFRLLNELRANGFTCPKGTNFPPNPTPLKFDCRLWKASDLHSKDMADKGYFSHTSRDGRSPWDRARAQGVNAGGENIAAGRSGAAEVLEQWKNSDGHCTNMMSASFRIFGVGRHFNANSKYRYYWTQMLGRASELASLDQSCLGDAPTAMPTLPPVSTQPPVSTPVAKECKDMEIASECEGNIACDAKVKNGSLKKCQKKKCKKIKDANTCALVEHCKPKMKKGEMKKCGNN